MAVSRAQGAQQEAAIAVDPSDPDVLLAGSNSVVLTHVYSSTDAGRTWTSTPGPPLPEGWGGEDCASDPAVGVDGSGRQYYAYLAIRECVLEEDARIVVAARDGPDDAWSVSAPLDPVAGTSDDKPALAVDDAPGSPNRGRVYLSWTRDYEVGVASTVVSHSDDGGRTWSPAAAVDDIHGAQIWSTLAVGRGGTVYVAWIDAESLRLVVDRSPDGVRFGDDVTAAPSSNGSTPQCVLSGVSIPAQPSRCVSAAPTLVVDASGGAYDGRVYLAYGDRAPDGGQDVLVARFDAELRRIGPPSRIGPREGGLVSDQFLPASALDQSDGTVWVCFYDTIGDSTRRRATFSCTSSRDGGSTWARPLRVADVPSDETESGRGELEYGDYEGVAAADGVAHPAWTDSRDLAERGEEIYTSAITSR